MGLQADLLEEIGVRAGDDAGMSSGGRKCAIAFPMPPPTARRTSAIVGAGRPNSGRVCW